MRIFKYLLSWLFSVSFVLGLPFYGISQNSGKTLVLEDFENEEVGTLPSGWYDRDGDKMLSKYRENARNEFKYEIVEEDGNKYLKYKGTRAKHINYPLANKEYINIYETPVLSWKARAWQLPENANEDNDSRNDVVMSIYVVFDFGRVALFKKVPKTIRYTWSTTLEKGAEYSKLFGNQKIVVLESGIENRGKWITFERNIVEDYRRLYGDNPPSQPLAILILSDGDSTGSRVEADYDDIMLKARGKQTGTISF